MKHAIVIGASSGIGRELALVLARNDYRVGIIARRLDLLKELKHEFPSQMTFRQADISHVSEGKEALQSLMRELEEVDLIVINAGVGYLNPELDWEKEKETIDVNVTGFCALAGQAFQFFLKQGRGHLVGISSISALGGNPIAPAYNASKAFISNYLEGLRKKSFKEKLNIVVTDIKPGYVDTAMAKGDGRFWIATPELAAEQIFDAIQKKKLHAYITHRWRLIGWLIKLMPDWLYNRI